MTRTVEVGLRTLRGTRKEENEDTAAVVGLILRSDLGAPVTVKPPGGSPVIALLADGMGGHAGGRVASGLTTERLSADDRLLGEADDIRAALEDAHAALYSAMRENPSLLGMGTTIVGVSIPPRGPATTFNVGDSRLFVRDEEVGIVQISVDHAERRGTGTGATLTQCLGGTSRLVQIAPHVGSFELEQGDRLVLCSDGLCDVLSSEEIATVLASPTRAANVAGRLVGLAHDAGAQDDLTTVVVDIAEVDT